MTALSDLGHILGSLREARDVIGELEKRGWRLVHENDENRAKYKQAVAYQVFASLADEFDMLDHSEVISVLDYLADYDGAEDPLPWPKSPLKQKDENE